LGHGSRKQGSRTSLGRDPLEYIFTFLKDFADWVVIIWQMTGEAKLN